MVLRGGPQYAQIAWEILLGERRGHAPHRRLEILDPDRSTYVERGAQPGVLDKATPFGLRFDVDVRPEPTPVNLRRTPLELAEVVYGAAG